jgi:Enterobacter phage Enc34, ssDNA-binding protein
MGTKSKDKDKKKRFILTPMFRVSFPNITEKNDMSDKYQISMLFSKGTDISKLVTAAKMAKEAKWPKGAPKGFRNPFIKVDDIDVDERYDGYEDGMIIVRAKAAYRPGVVDSNRNEIELEELNTYLYGGMYARAAVSAYAYDKAGNRGVAFGVDAIQIIKDGEPLGSRVTAEEAFADVEDTDDFDNETAISDEDKDELEL